MSASLRVRLAATAEPGRTTTPHARSHGPAANRSTGGTGSRTVGPDSEGPVHQGRVGTVLWFTVRASASLGGRGQPHSTFLRAIHEMCMSAGQQGRHWAALALRGLWVCGCPCLQKCQCLGVRGHMAERPHWLSDPAARRRAQCALRPAVGARARASARHRPHRDRGFSGQTSGADPLTPETTQGPGRRFRETPAPRWPLCLPSALLDVPTNLGQGPAGPRADGRVPAVTEAQAAAKAHDSGEERYLGGLPGCSDLGGHPRGGKQ